MTIFKQWREVLDESKTQTRRVSFYPKVGSIQAVVPKYLSPSVWWHPKTLEQVENSYVKARELIWGRTYDLTIKEVCECLTTNGYLRGRVLITNKRIEPVQNITESDAIDEGIRWSDNNQLFYCEIPGHFITAGTARGCYAALWDAINTKKSLRWDANPVITAVTFELVK